MRPSPATLQPTTDRGPVGSVRVEVAPAPVPSEAARRALLDFIRRRVERGRVRLAAEKR